MAQRLISALALFTLFQICYGKVHFSTLQKTLIVTASPEHKDVLKSGEDKIKVTWGLNQSFPSSTDKDYKEVKVKLCFSHISQVDRAWRKTKDDLSTDKTCQSTIVEKPYMQEEESYEWLIKRSVPTATYFIRVYAFNSEGHEVGYGQTSNDEKTTNLFEIMGISGRHASLDIAAGVFSAFSVISLFGFFYMEKRKGRTAAAAAAAAPRT